MMVCGSDILIESVDNFGAPPSHPLGATTSDLSLLQFSPHIAPGNSGAVMGGNMYIYIIYTYIINTYNI